MPKRRPPKSKPDKSSKPRPGWKGNLTFGLVSFAVEAFNALDRDEGDIHFHQLHAKCHRRIQYQKVCPVHGAVPNDEIVSGYEVSKGKYVEVAPEEFDELRPANQRALTIDAFVAPDAVDPLYFDGRMYYLTPTDVSAEGAYGVIVAAMAREGVNAIGKLVFSGKDQIALLRPFGTMLHLAMLNFKSEMRPLLKSRSVAKPSAAQGRQVKMAQTLIKEWSVDKFDFSQYTDTYREQVAALIDAKSKGKKISPPEEEEAPVTLSLMDALKKSLAHPRSQAKAKSPGPRKRSAS